MDTIDGMRSFVAVATTGSFTQGAQQLGQSTKLVSKYVQQLEKRLGAQLFIRTTRSVSLTEVGNAYLDRCIPLLAQFDELEEVVEDQKSELEGLINISVPFGLRQLVHAARSFQQLNPKVNIRMNLSGRPVSLIEDGVDLTIGFGQDLNDNNLDDKSLVAKKLTIMPMSLLASPQYIHQFGQPKTPNELTEHNCLLLDIASGDDLWSFEIEGEQHQISVSGNFVANSHCALILMALDGAGIVNCPYDDVKDYIESGELVPLLIGYQQSEQWLYAAYPSDRYPSARVRRLIEYLVVEFS